MSPLTLVRLSLIDCSMPTLIITQIVCPPSNSIGSSYMKHYTRVLSRLDPLVEQVQKEMPNHLHTFGNIKQIYHILVIVNITFDTIQRPCETWLILGAYL